MTSAYQRIAAAAQRNMDKLSKRGYGKYLALLSVTLCITAEVQLLKTLWPHVRGTMSDIHLYALSLLVLNIAVTVFYNLTMYFVYTRKMPFFEQFRVSKDTPWPWEAGQTEWNAMKWRSLRVSMVNMFVIGPIISLVDSYVDFRIVMDLESVPSVWTMGWQVCLFLLVMEFMLYWVHRFIHHPRLYWIHKQHHEYTVTTTLTAQYAHPLEHIFATIIPTGFAYSALSKVYPVHIFTVIVWITIRALEGYDDHSGYDWPWAQSQIFPFSADGSYHYFHHKQNVGNYNMFLNLFDTLFDTNKQYYKMVASQPKND